MINAIPFKEYFHDQYEAMNILKTVNLDEMAQILQSIRSNLPKLDTHVITYKNVSRISDIVNGINRIECTVTGRAKNAPHHTVLVNLKK